METENKVRYIVMKLLTKVVISPPYVNEETNILLGGCAGYIPVFDDIKDAEKEACNGKYQIIAVKLMENE